MTSYTLTLSALLLTGGDLGDRLAVVLGPAMSGSCVWWVSRRID